jgi:tetratricopeptide (TPR) repeat protein
MRRQAPSDPYAQFQRALAHFARGQFDLSIALLEPLEKVLPVYAEACNLLGLLIAREQGRFDEGAVLVRRALAARPALHEARANLGWILTELGEFNEGMQCLDDLLQESPDNHEVRLMRATANLKHGFFSKGWRDYEARHHSSTAIANPYPYPLWNGSPAPQATLLVVAEQGVGDQIMFASCLGEARVRVGGMLIESHPHLVPLLRRAFPGDRIGTRSEGRAPPDWAGGGKIDMQIPIGSLPQFFRNNLEEFPRHTGYFAADPERVLYWSGRLQELGPGLKVGLSWRGGTVGTRRSLRSIQPEVLAPLLRQPVHFINLQYGSSEPDISAFGAIKDAKFVHWPDALDNFDETAALVVALDLVISVCTAVIHLAGALGRPVWILTPASPEWRYLSAGSTLPWYPSVRLFRQRNAFEWDEVVERVALALTEHRLPMRLE